jgi:hypothetical protein
MKTRNLVSALIIGSVMSVGTAMAQTSPTNTPNDSSGVPINQSVPPGQNTPAPSNGSTQDHAKPSKAHMKKKATRHTTKHKKSTMSKSKMGKDSMDHSSANGSAPSDSQPVPNTGGK